MHEALTHTLLVGGPSQRTECSTGERGGHKRNDADGVFKLCEVSFHMCALYDAVTLK